MYATLPLKMQSIWIKIKQNISTPKILAFSALVILVFLSVLHPIGAQTVTQGYKSDTPLQRGMVVVVKQDDPTKIEPAKLSTIEKIIGVVVAANDAPVTISSEEQNNFVATIGRYDVLVSDQAGAVKSGDYLTVSALEGIATKAGTNDQVVIGKALGDFDGKNSFGSTDLKDSDGFSKKVQIGRIPMDIAIGPNPQRKATQANVPEILKRVSETVAGKPVNPVRIYIGMTIFFVSAIIAGSMLFAGIRSTTISIGRNPLSKKSILKGLVQIILMSLIVFIVGIFGVYLLIRL